MGPYPRATLVDRLLLLGHLVAVGLERGKLGFCRLRALGRLSWASWLEIGLVGFGPLGRMDKQSGGGGLRR